MYLVLSGPALLVPGINIISTHHSPSSPYIFFIINQPRSNVSTSIYIPFNSFSFSNPYSPKLVLGSIGASKEGILGKFIYFHAVVTLFSCRLPCIGAVEESERRRSRQWPLGGDGRGTRLKWWINNEGVDMMMKDSARILSMFDAYNLGLTSDRYL